MDATDEEPAASARSDVGGGARHWGVWRGVWLGGDFWAWYTELPAAFVALLAGCGIQMGLDRDDLGHALRKASLIALLVLLPTPLLAWTLLRAMSKGNSSVLLDLMGLTGK